MNRKEEKYDFVDARALAESTLAAFRPPPDIDVAEWAERYRRLSPESSAAPGKYNLDRTPYLREPLQMIGKPGVVSVSMMTSAQIGKSTLVENAIGYAIDLDPCPILHISPTIESMKMFSRERLAPMIRDTPVLKGKVKDARSRDSGNTIANKSFPGGHIAMVGSNSPSGLASRPVRGLVADEIDRFERSAGTEGDPLKLGIKRTTTYWNRWMLFVSTPGDRYNAETMTGSRIEKEFLAGDQRYYHVPCPHCGHKQVLRWSNVQWEEDQPGTAVYVCEENGCVWDDTDRHRAIDNGEWVAEKPFSGRVSYHLSQLYSKFAPLSDGVKDFLDSKDDPALLKTWVNTFLGDPWEDRGERLEWSHLRDHREEMNKYEDIPEEITIITAAVDVQDDRFELEFVGWGDDEQSWSLDYVVIYGDMTAPETWNELERKLNTIFTHPLFGEMVARCVAIDSGGHYTQEVYSFSERSVRYNAVKGVPGAGKPFVGRPLKNTIGNARVFPLGVDTIKETVVTRLKQRDPEKPGYCRFPADRDDDYFRMLTAEEQRVRFSRGHRRIEWVKVRKRNEAFDCRVYNTAALEMVHVNINAERRRMLLEIRKRDSTTPTKKSKVPKRSWVEGWRHD